jgi:quinolinate synthase
MKKTKLGSVYHALRGMKYAIELDEGIIGRARRTLERMLEAS